MPPRVATNVGIVTLASVVQLVLQFALQVVLAKRFGAGATLDAFSAALIVPTVLSTIVTVSLSYVLIPILSAKFSCKDSRQDAWKLTSAVGFWVVLSSMTMAGLLAGGAKLIVGFLYPGFEPQTQETTVQVLMWLAWQFPLGTVVSWMQSVQNAQHRFFWPAAMAALGALINLICAVQWVETGILGYAQAIIFSSTIHVLLLVLPSAGELVRTHCLWHPEMKRLLVAWAPLLMGSIYLRLDPLFDRVFGSFLSEGSIAHLSFAQRFIAALLTISTGGILTVIFPQFGAASALGKEALRERLQRSLHGLYVVLVPILIGGWMFAEPVTRDLLERGEFTPGDTDAVAHLFQVLLLFFVSASIADLLARAFYSLGDTGTPTLIGAIGMTIGLIAKYLLSQRFEVTGLAWASAGYYCLTTVALGMVLQRRIPSVWYFVRFSEFLIPIVASLLCCAVALGITRLVPTMSTLIAAPVAAVCYPLLLVLLREPLASELFSALSARLQK